MLSNAKNDVPRHGLGGLLCSVTVQEKASLFLHDIVLSLAFVACTNSSLSRMLVLAKFTNSISTME